MIQDPQFLDFKAAFEAMPTICILVHTNAPKYTILAVTQGLLLTQKPGTTREDLVGKGFFEPFPPSPDDPDFTGESNLRTSFEYVIAHKEMHHLPVQRYDLAKEDGTFSERYWTAYNKPIFDERGNVMYIMHYSEEITDKIKASQIDSLKESEKNFRELVDLVPQIMWTARPDGYLDYYNKRWYEYTGFLPGLEDQSWIPILHADDVQLCVDTWYNSILTGKPYQMEYRFKDYETSGYRWFLAKALPIRNKEGIITKWFGTCTDIHDQKTNTEKLEALVNARTIELQKSNKGLQQFAHVASHDLKEPVRKIKTFLTLLEDESKNILTDKGKMFLGKIVNSAERISTLIESVLQYSTLNRVEKPIEQVDLNVLIKNIETDLEIVIQQKKAVIHYTTLPTIEGAQILIHQLFYNLINNSLKFARVSVEPKILITSTLVWEKDTMFAQITVSDNGIGFAPVYAEKVFEAFTRLNTKDKYEGTGLGLALCKSIVDRHHGQITAIGKENDGAVFTIRLPMKQRNPLI